MLVSPLTVSASLRVTAHLALFKHGEWHLHGAHIIIFHTLASAALVALERITVQQSWAESAFEMVKLVSTYLASLMTSIVIYRLFFHRLRHFPGPKLAAVSKLWHCWRSRYSTNHLLLEEWYHQYGPFVRTGPNEITCITPTAIEAFDGPRSKVVRSDWNDLIHPRKAALFTRDMEFHDARRTTWSDALNNRVMMQYESRIQNHVANMMDHIDKRLNTSLDINSLMRNVAFNAMGDFAFSKNFGLTSGTAKSETKVALEKIKSGLSILGVFTHMIWLPQLAFSLAPGLWKTKDWFDGIGFCDKCMDERMQKEVLDPDIASWFIDDIQAKGFDKTNRLLLSGDTATLIVAGSYSTFPTLISIPYFLAKHPDQAEKLYNEVKDLDNLDAKTLNSLPQLNGVINEAMRLMPAILTVFTRHVPDEGLTIDGQFIPGDSKVATSRYSVFRLPEAFKKPLEYIPERWYSRPDLIIDKRAFHPFGIGKTGCVGKPLALITIRMATANLARKFKMSFPKGFDVAGVERDMVDELTAKPGQLDIVFTPR